MNYPVFKLFLQTDSCVEAPKPDLGSGESINENASYNNSQGLINETPFVSTDCAPPAEFTKNLVNGISGINDMHVENACTNTESIIKQNVYESSVEQGKNSALPENMDISSDSSQQGKVAKYYIDKMSLYIFKSIL